MNVYSNAFNFSSYLNGSVDPRTGQYGGQIRLATLYPEGPQEVSRDIMLSFSMLNSINSPYGIGWQLSNTSFDLVSLNFTLLNGGRYQTSGLPSVGGTMIFKDYKLKDLVVKRPDTNTLHVIYKDGSVEVLRRTSSTVPYRIDAILFENGERLTFRYGTTGFLERILNHKQEDLLILTYSTGRLSYVDARVEGGRYARIQFTQINNLLTRVTAPYDRNEPPGAAAYAFEYWPEFRNGLVPLKRVYSPMGGEELISYEENGHQYANNQYIPRVVRWVQTPGASQPDMIRTYAYSQGKNFTGYPFSGGFREGEDNLYLVGSAYDYWTEETSRSANNAVLSVSRTTYNKFHLLTEERVTREGTRTQMNITYNTVPGLFPAQPANLHLAKTITKRYELVAGGTPREEIQQIETDDYGNELSRTEPSGIRTEYSYYPIAGESGKCPADPHGLFQRYLKEERFVPVGGAPAARLTEYTHTRVPQTGSSYFVLQQSINQAGVLAMQQTYYQTPVELAGRLKSATSTVGGQALTSEFSYVIQGDNVLETRRLKGREGQWLEAKRTLSLVNRRLLSMTRDGESTLDLAYDVSGRLTVETVAPGTPQKATRQYAYHFAQGVTRAHLITTDAQGIKAITYYDGAGRQVAEAQVIGSNQERPTCTWRYDALGQTVEVVDMDYVTEGQRLLKSTHTYNRWGNASRVTHADGRVVINEYDPLLNLTEEGVVGGERRITYFNAYNQPIKVERLDASNNKVEVESYTYDGLGRCLTVLDINKTLTELTYDGFDRLVTTLQKPVDGTPQRLSKTDYVPGTSSELASAITVDGKRLGARTYDSLGRMTSQVRGTGQATTWEYEAGWFEPIAMVSPRGGRQVMTYDKQLDVPTRIEMTGLPVSTYRYDPVGGALTRSEANGLIHELFQDAIGHPEKDIQTASGTSLTSQYGYSPAGRLLHQTSADGQRSALAYDTLGRFSKMTTGPLVIEQTYDTLGRPQNLTTTYESTKILTRVTYDSLGREAERRFEQNGALFQVLASTYYVNGMLATRFLRNASSQVVIGETFTYDAYLRLKTYRCEGPEHPKDHLGRGIVGEDYTFDSLNNITRVVTAFADGTQDTCQRYFTGTDPTQLTRLTHTRPVQDVTLAYDAAGNLQASPEGHAYTYNGFEQLTAVKAGSLNYSYKYDAEARQVHASRGAEPPVMLAYAGRRLDLLVEGSKKIRFADGGDEVMARSGGVDGPQLHMNDASGSVRGLSTPGQPHVRRHYTPYGDAYIPLDDGKVRSMADLQLPAFNGERLDVPTNLYFLGNGLRAYSPSLRMFLQPDLLGPFDEGGINCYAYCAGNPINMRDPSGMWPGWVKWVLTGVALALSVVTLGFGAVGLAATVSAAAASATSVAAGLAAATVAMTAVGAPVVAGVFAGAAATATAAGATIAAAAAAAAAATGWVIASKAAITVGAGLGVVGGTLSVAGLATAEVDKAMGWDRSHIIRRLGWASLGFSIASLVVGIGGAYTSWHMTYTSAASKAAGTGKLLESPAALGLIAGGKRMLGLSYKFTDKWGITPYSQLFGATRAVLRFTNLGRSIQARVGSPATPRPEGGGPAPAQSQSQPTARRVVDMPGSSAGFYQSFREEASRIRQPILGELYRG
ncbi:RHS repeat-associated core domain-containing protein [Pseudomonas sp. WS 5010]|jgi:RHS repeat-associated protein|uniref:RHS repeat domain-containing protein n=1 Tax=Pseudomonas sp. WS 5010 TaxID=2717489 RepID=UPI001472E303|nr:RHS repeat-associated core domain-containing protein [Pseudomonas sp. WS 5010]NMX86112.1 RHS repeat-associated core domain-containing protein [Pseudomonas sp. WS 5010]